MTALPLHSNGRAVAPRPPPTTERNINMKAKKLQDAIKGMKVESWEVREHSNGKRKLYVRFIPKEKPVTINVEET